MNDENDSKLEELMDSQKAVVSRVTSLILFLLFRDEVLPEFEPQTLC